MKRLIAVLLCACMVLSLAACSGQQAEQPQPQSTSTSVPVQESETPSGGDSQSDAPKQLETEQSNILIAYFTWAENTHVENPEAVDVDATTSASVLLPGNSAKIAGWIQNRVGGDLFSIVVTEPYSSDYDECLERAADEKAQNARPALVNHVENIEDYDVVFLGFPNWWYTVPMAVYSFLEEYDFLGKTVIPFVTHGTSGLSSTIQDITSALPAGTKVLEPIGVYRPDVDAAQPKIDEWLEGLGY